MTFILESVKTSFFNELPDTIMSVLETPTLIDDPLASGEYFATPELMQRLNLIQHLIQHSGQLLLVLAELGYGKTALLTRLYASVNEHWWMHCLPANANLSPDALITNVLTAFGINQHKASQPLMDNLRSHFAATRYKAKLPVLLIDDAHLLPLTTLKVLVELAMQGEPLTRARVVIFCEPQITSILATPEFELVHNTLLHTLDIPPLSKTQVRGYVQLRLQDDAQSYQHLFSEEVIQEIYRQSNGIPAKINPLIQKILHKFKQQWSPTPPQIHHPPSQQKLLLISLLMMLLGSVTLAIYWFYPEMVQEKINKPTHRETIATAENSSDDTILYPLRLPVNGINTLDSFDLTAISLTDMESTEQLLEGQIKAETWIQHQPSMAYTLQILGAHDLIALKKFLTNHALALEEITVLETRHQHKAWYILLYGTYPNRQEALTALATLPLSLRQSTQPWVRQWKDVQASLAK